MSGAQRILRYRIFAVIWASLVLIILLIPGGSVPSVHFWTFGLPFDKTVHGGLFFVQALLLYLAMARTSPIFTHRPPTSPPPTASSSIAWRAAAFTILYGAATELLQRTVPGRNSEWSDLLADTIGALLIPLLNHVNIPQLLRRVSRDR